MFVTVMLDWFCSTLGSSSHDHGLVKLGENGEWKAAVPQAYELEAATPIQQATLKPGEFLWRCSVQQVREEASPRSNSHNQQQCAHGFVLKQQHSSEVHVNGDEGESWRLSRPRAGKQLPPRPVTMDWFFLLNGLACTHGHVKPADLF
ncbi:hypothetical protein LR48_Vigan07g172500 [Vigna angularis]|uniref:Uncharacterized protein n=1 Tax=Phaseolus angularis TaxID=3914 RepID=A0A0L9UZA9_PHAAN|nr:hypothetical protein LR48_Vigan07g172500 [Vigna angularis]